MGFPLGGAGKPPLLPPWGGDLYTPLDIPEGGLYLSPRGGPANPRSSSHGGGVGYPYPDIDIQDMTLSAEIYPEGYGI